MGYLIVSVVLDFLPSPPIPSSPPLPAFPPPFFSGPPPQNILFRRRLFPRTIPDPSLRDHHVIDDAEE